MIELSSFPAIVRNVAPRSTTFVLQGGLYSPFGEPDEKFVFCASDPEVILFSLRPEFLLRHLVRKTPNSHSERLADQYAIRLYEEKPGLSLEAVSIERDKVEKRISKVIDLLSSHCGFKKVNERILEIERVLDFYSDDPNPSDSLSISEFNDRLHYLETLASLKNHIIGINSDLVRNSFSRYQASRSKYL